MKKLKQIFKKINYMHFIAISITLMFLAFSVFLYQNSFIRIKESFRDVWYSIKYNFLTITDLGISPVSVTSISAIDIGKIFPLNWEEFKVIASKWFTALFSQENLLAYFEKFSSFYLIAITIIELIVVLFFLLKILIEKHISTPNNNYGKGSKNLIVYKKIETYLKPVKRWFAAFFNFIKTNAYKKIWLAIWLYNLNIFTIVLEFIAFYLFFIISFDFSNLYIQIYKLVIDVVICLKGLPLCIWFLIALIILNKWRTNKGYERLEHFEAYDSGFIKNLPTVNVVYGLMGGGKGQIMTDIVLTKNKLMRSDAKETMQKFDRMFPYFPFILLEKTIMRLRRMHVIYSLATIEKYIKQRKHLFDNALNNYNYNLAFNLLWRYDFINCGLEYDNNLYMVNIFEAIEEYAKAYYIYTTVEFTITNYAIRSDGILHDFGNLPLWDFDFFHRNSRELNKISRYGKILDQDILRRGKKVNKDNPFADTLEFGVVVMTELDKERGNQFVEREMKINDDETNQKNDLFNFGLKLDRHPSTVDFKHYMFIIFDLQRLGSTNADLQECGGHLGVGKKDKKCFAMPLFFFEEFFYGLFKGLYEKFYDESRFYHGDNTLLIHLIKKYLGGFYNYYDRMYNLFGYDKHYLQIEDLRSNTFTEHPYYLTYKKNHARRYYTDSLVDFFRQSALKRNVGLDDYPEYKGVKATSEEFAKQNSYFQQKLNNVFDSNVEPKIDNVRNETAGQAVNKLKLKKPLNNG